ncbi:MAG: NAD-dependent epimerase/dehydratase family protein [Myxococcaceae bacterium]
MKVLVIGGNRFVGVELVMRLLARGDAVTLLNRGQLGDPFGGLVERIHADRGTDAFDHALASRTFDAVVDLALFDGPQAERAARVLKNKTAHWITVSTGQVYLVKTKRPTLATEDDFAGEVMAAPPTPAEEEDWRYGLEKRAMEEVLLRGEVPFTTFRLPMVHGGRDWRRRLDSVVWRVMDGGPVLLTRPDAPMRHVFSSAVVRALVDALERGPTNRAWNLAWSDNLSVRSFVVALAGLLGAEPRIVATTDAQLTAAGLDPKLACHFNTSWMSALDASAAREKLDFVHEPLGVWLSRFVHASMSAWSSPPPSFSQREAEKRLQL